MKFSFQKLSTGIIIVIVLVFVLLRGDELNKLVETLREGASVLPLVLAVMTQLCKYFAQSFAYSRSFAAVEEKMRPRDTLPLVFGTFFTNTVAPSLNTAGMALVVNDARRRGISTGKATSAAILMQMSIESGFVTIMLVGFVILEVTTGLDLIWFLLGLFVILMVAIMGGILVLGHKKPKLLMRILTPIEGLVNKILKKFKRKPLKPWAARMSVSFGEAAGLIVQHPKSVLQVLGFSVLASTCELACFCLVGLGFGVDNPQALICGYVIATLFAMISITPQGVGFVETAVVILFGAYDISSGVGMAIALVYRSLVFWMPFLIGAVLIRKTKTFQRNDDKPKEEIETEGPGKEKILSEEEQVPSRRSDSYVAASNLESQSEEILKMQAKRGTDFIAGSGEQNTRESVVSESPTQKTRTQDPSVRESAEQEQRSSETAAQARPVRRKKNSHSDIPPRPL